MNPSASLLYNLLHTFFKAQDHLQKVKAGTVLFQEKEKVENIYLILKGSVALGRVHMNGKEFIMKIINNKDIIVEYQLFKNNAYYHFSAKTLEDCEFICIKKSDFEEFVSHDPEAMNALSAWLSLSYLKAQMKCQDLLMNGKKGGLFSILIRLCHSYGIVTEEGILIDLPLTHQDLANLTYGTREVVQRSLKELRDKGIVSYDQQRITIRRLNFLREEVDCQNCASEVCGLN